MVASAMLSSVLGSRAPVQGRQTQRGHKMTTTCKAGNWYPGSNTPSYLENVPGSFGFDPLGFGRVPSNLERFKESELIHSRWAMLGAAGVLAVELAGQGSWYDAPKWVLTGDAPKYLGVELPFDVNTLLAIEFVAIAGAEIQRNAESDAEKRKYPGGPFDPLGLSRDAKALEVNKLKEIKNGRLAMLANLGFVAQQSATGKSPLEGLAAHIASPWAVNFATNGVSVPGLPAQGGLTL